MKRTIRERAALSLYGMDRKHTPANCMSQTWDGLREQDRQDYCDCANAVLREVLRGLPKRDTDGGNSGFLRGYSVGYNQALRDVRKELRRKQ